MRGLMNQSKVVLFMKGTPDAPRCGFSRQTVAIFKEQNVDFTHFDILTDESVRQGMYITLPKVNGSLICWDNFLFRTESAEQLAYVPSVDHQQRVRRRTRYCAGDGGERRVEGVVGGLSVWLFFSRIVSRQGNVLYTYSRRFLGRW